MSPSQEVMMKTSLSHEESEWEGTRTRREQSGYGMLGPLWQRASILIHFKCESIWRESPGLHTSERP